jgi:ribonuclease Z
MTEIHILGSGSAIATDSQANTHLALVAGDRSVLIDCPGMIVPRLARAGIRLDSLSDLIATHFHPDHVSGIPSLIMSLWLLGRVKPLRVHGPVHAITRLRAMMELYQWETWPGLYRVEFNPLPDAEAVPVLQAEAFEIHASPACHLIPSVALRIRRRPEGWSAVYSGDTEPCDEVMRLAEGVDLLIHEATGEGRGHSSAAQAAQIAARVGARRLILIHYSFDNSSEEQLLSSAAEHFKGEVVLAEDLMSVSL